MHQPPPDHDTSAATRRTRTRVAQQAARLISEHGIRDYGHAKRKAASQLGVSDEGKLPRNTEVEAALRVHQALFAGAGHDARLRALRTAACEALEFLAPFHPRLVGPVLTGTADAHSAVCLHVYADAPETVQRFLEENGIDCTQATRRVRLRRDLTRDLPVLQLAADGQAFDITILPVLARRQAPLDRIDGEPMARASLATVRALLDEEPPAQEPGRQ